VDNPWNGILHLREEEEEEVGDGKGWEEEERRSKARGEGEEKQEKRRRRKEKVEKTKAKERRRELSTRTLIPPSWNCTLFSCFIPFLPSFFRDLLERGRNGDDLLNAPAQPTHIVVPSREECSKIGRIRGEREIRGRTGRCR
jgi:hypothetical protein